MKAQKKPVIVDVFEYDTKKKDIRDLTIFCEGKIDVNLEGEVFVPYIKTLEGNMRVSDGDFIIRGVQGEFYPCKPDIFHETYELIDDEPNKFKHEGYESLSKEINEIIKEHSYDSFGFSLYVNHKGTANVGLISPYLNRLEVKKEASKLNKVAKDKDYNIFFFEDSYD